MAKPTPDKVGKRFGMLVVTGKAPKRLGSYSTRWYVLCDCGNTHDVDNGKLHERYGIKSCGCLEGGRAKGANATHGESETRLYHIWTDIKTRCLNPKRNCYPSYGGRGIKICDEWRDSFEAFKLAVGEAPSETHSIDRKDNNGNYEPGNVRWATAAEQSRNKRNNRYINTPKGRMLACDAAKEYGIKFGSLMNRIHRGWPESKWLIPEQINGSWQKEAKLAPPIFKIFRGAKSTEEEE